MPKTTTKRRRSNLRNRRLNLESLEPRLALTGTWTALSSAAPTNIGTMMLLSDGTVIASASTRGVFSDVSYHNASKSWYKLTPDASGSYVNGTWSQLADMSLERLYFPSNVLPDGRVFVLGGKYEGPNGFGSNPNNGGNGGYTGEIYNPVANTWSSVANIPLSNFGSAPTMLLSDGSVLAAGSVDPQTYVYNPATNTWSSGPTKLDGDWGHRETLTKLPDGSGLSFNIWGNPGHTQRFDPATNSWLDSGTPAVNLINPSDKGLGPAILLPDGRVFQIGRGGTTALYTPATTRGGTGTWAEGPVLAAGDGFGASAVLPNGHVLYVGGDLGHSPTDYAVEYDPVTNSVTNVASPTPDLSSWNSIKQQLLVLPSGQVLFSYEHSQLYVYTPDGVPQAAWKPTITSVAANGDHFTLTGTQLNGLDAGASYNGDGAAEMDSNYPIVRLDDGVGHIYYARTSNWSSTGVQTGNTAVSTDFSLPASMPYGTYSLAVIANGIASDPAPFTGGYQGRSSADLAVSYVTPGRISEGDTFAYTLRVTNNGPTNATGVVLTDTLGANWKYVSATTGQGTFTRSGNVVTFSMGSIAAGQSATATITVQSLEEGQFANTATVAGSVFDVDQTNNSVVSNTTVYEPSISVSYPTTANGKKVNNQVVATFTHASGVEPVSAFIATVDWGDGTTSAGAISLSGTTYSVKGSHTYSSGGSHTVTTTVVEAGASPNVAVALATTSTTTAGSTSNGSTTTSSQSDRAPTDPPRLVPAAVDQSLLPAIGTSPHHARHTMPDAADESALDELFALL